MDILTCDFLEYVFFNVSVTVTEIKLQSLILKGEDIRTTVLDWM